MEIKFTIDQFTTKEELENIIAVLQVYLQKKIDKDTKVPKIRVIKRRAAPKLDEVLEEEL
jgi:hypothetical protein